MVGAGTGAAVGLCVTTADETPLTLTMRPRFEVITDEAPLSVVVTDADHEVESLLPTSDSDATTENDTPHDTDSRDLRRRRLIDIAKLRMLVSCTPSSLAMVAFRTDV